METKQVLSLTRSEIAVSLFVDVAAGDKTQAAKLAELADTLAEQVAELEQPHSTKCALIEATYAGEFKTLAANRNTVATLRALIVARVAADAMVEIAPPSKDGKKGAVTKPASQLNASEAKKFAAEIKQEMARAEETPEARKAREAAEAAAAAAAQAAINAAATAAAKAKAEEAIAYATSEAARPALIAALAKQGLKIVADKKAPK